jgi:hypothetical protein
MTRPIARSEERAFCERPMGRAAARRSPKAILDSRSGLDERALQELDGEVRSAGARSTHKLDIVHASPQSWPSPYQQVESKTRRYGNPAPSQPKHRTLQDSELARRRPLRRFHGLLHYDIERT